MKRTTNIALAVGTALSFGLAVAPVEAHPYGMGWGNGYGYGGGPGYGMGYGMHGYGPGPGYGPQGYGMGPGRSMHGYGMGPGYGMGYGYGMGPRSMFNAYPGTSEDRLADLKSELGITAKQETAWQAFAKSVKQQDESRESWFAKMHEARAAGSLPELLTQRDEIFRQQQAEGQATTSALKELYAALTPEQKTIADQSFGGFGPGHCVQAYRSGPGGRVR